MDEKVDKHTVEVDGQQADVYRLGKAIRPEQFAYLLESMLNGYGNPIKNGERIGQLLQGCHRTLQGCAINFALGILVGMISDWTDARNEIGVETCRKIKALLDNGALKFQPFV